MKKWVRLFLILTLAVVLFLTGCQPDSNPGTGPSGTIVEAGSTTIQPLAEKLAESFADLYPRVDVTIQGGGSSVGIRSVSEGTVDIGAASRELDPSEPNLVKHHLAYDGIAVIVNPANPVSSLTKAQIRDIFAGRITNWNQVGGMNKEIHVAAREEGSGTRTAFEELVMNKALVTKYAILQPTTGALRHVVVGDPAAITFVSFGYLDSAVKTIAIDGVPATDENIENRSYSLVRPLYFLTRAQPEGLPKLFIDYCLSPEGQQIVTQEGYVSIQSFT